MHERGGHVGAAEDLGPVGKTEVGGDDHRPALMTLGQNLKEQFRPFLGKGHVPEFIEDEQVKPGVFSEQAAQVLFGTRFDQIVGQGVAGDEAYEFALRQASMPRAVARSVFAQGRVFPTRI